MNKFIIDTLRKNPQIVELGLIKTCIRDEKNAF